MLRTEGDETASSRQEDELQVFEPSEVEGGGFRSGGRYTRAHCQHGDNAARSTDESSDADSPSETNFIEKLS